MAVVSCAHIEQVRLHCRKNPGKKTGVVKTGHKNVRKYREMMVCKYLEPGNIKRDKILI